MLKNITRSFFFDSWTRFFAGLFFVPFFTSFLPMRS